MQANRMPERHTVYERFKSIVPLHVRRLYWWIRSGGHIHWMKHFLTFKYERLYLDELILHDDLKLLPPSLAKIHEQLKTRYQMEWFSEKAMEKLQSYLTYRKDLSEQEVIEWLRSGHTTIMVFDKEKIIGDCWL